MASSWPITAPACDVTMDTWAMRSYPTGPTGTRAAALAAALLLFAGAGPAVADDGRPDRDFTIEDPRITESSGLAASRAHPGVYWTHNDSDDGPYVFAVDSRTGKTLATITMRGVGEPRTSKASPSVRTATSTSVTSATIWTAAGTTSGSTGSPSRSSCATRPSRPSSTT